MIFSSVLLPGPNPANATVSASLTASRDVSLRGRLHGLQVSIVGDVAQFEAFYGDLWEQLPLERCESPGDSIAIAIAVSTKCRRASNRHSIVGDGVTDRRAWGDIELASKDRVVIVYHPTVDFEVDLCAGLGRLTLAVGLEPITRRILHDVFLIGLSRLIAHHGMFDLHAACVSRDDLCYLLVGASGTGKSTATVNLIRSGWEYVSDDAVLLRSGSEGVEALSFRRTPFIDPRALSHLPELAKVFSHPQGGRKKFLDVGGCYGAQPRHRCHPSAIVLCELTDRAASILEPVAGVEVLLGLIAQSASLGFTREKPRAQMEMLKALVEQCRGLRLRAGTDLLDQPERLSQLLMEGAQSKRPRFSNASQRRLVGASRETSRP